MLSSYSTFQIPYDFAVSDCLDCFIVSYVFAVSKMSDRTMSSRVLNEVVFGLIMMRIVRGGLCLDLRLYGWQRALTTIFTEGELD
jgi:hypothetical protein